MDVKGKAFAKGSLQLDSPANHKFTLVSLIKKLNQVNENKI